MSALDYLQQLSTNRFALEQLTKSDYQAVYHYLQSCFLQSTDDNSSWYIIGTDGCHLCDLAYQTAQQALSINPQNIKLQQIDLIDVNDKALIDVLGLCIPVLVTPTRLIAYPFGAMDVIAILNNATKAS